MAEPSPYTPDQAAAKAHSSGRYVTAAIWMEDNELKYHFHTGGFPFNDMPAAQLWFRTQLANCMAEGRKKAENGVNENQAS